MLKHLTATGIAVAGITGVMLFASPANAESLTVKHNGCYGLYHALPAYCYQHPGGHHGWRRWHRYHPWNPYRFHRYHH